MKKLIALAFIASVAFIASGSGVYAQLMVPVVSSCAGQTYTAGQNRLLTQDITGDLCTNATGGGGGGGNTTIIAPLGGLGIPDGSGVSVSLTGTVPTGFTTPCAGALGDVGFQACLIQIAQLPPNVNVSSTATPLTGETVSSHTYMDVNAGLIGGSAPGTAGSPSGGVVSVQNPNDPCNSASKTTYPLSSNATSLTQIIAASGSTKIYICSIAVVTASATAFNLNTGTGSNCASNTAALIGSTTAANGMSFAANGGFTLGNGGNTVASTPASSEICILQSNASYSSGVITYVQQ